MLFKNLNNMIIRNNQCDDYRGMPLLINHHYAYNGKNTYSNNPKGIYPLVDYESDGMYCQILLTEGPWVVRMNYLTYYGPLKEDLTTNTGAIHLLKGELI